jgi:transposase InsO family protein
MVISPHLGFQPGDFVVAVIPFAFFQGCSRARKRAIAPLGQPSDRDIRLRATKDTAPTYLVRDNDRAYGQAFQRRIRAMGIRDRPISPKSPWQNPYAERLIGTLRRECLDHVLIVSEQHLRRMLASYSSYYNESRTHLALEKDAPLRRAIQRCGAIITTPILCGLHHRYVRI